jgi:DNA-binding transcriptional ArsR family regulator
MGWWQVGTDTLAGGRFLVSPLAETTACLLALEYGGGYPGQRAWLDEHLPAYRERLAGDPVTAALIRAALGRNWLADFLTCTPTGAPGASFDEELALVRAAPPAAVRADLAVSLGRPVPEVLHRTDLAARAADLLDWVWTRAVLPYWPARRRILEADVLARTAQLTRGGWAAALDHLRPGTRWLGDGRLQINTYDYPPRDIAGARLFFIPVTAHRGWVSWTGDERSPGARYAVIYPGTGALAEPGGAPVPAGLANLLGPGRAGVLVLLDAPKSTTQLVALTAQALGSVGRHLKVLLDARLVQRRRLGRSVLYYRTAAGDALVHAQSAARDAGLHP